MRCVLLLLPLSAAAQSGPTCDCSSCSSDYPTCCPADSANRCCPPGYPNCCPLGSKYQCCPTGYATCTADGCFAADGAAAPLRGAGGAAPPAPLAAESVRAAFDAWRAQHGKAYDTDAERARRLANFRAHVALAGPRPRYNHLADLSRAEFEAAYKMRVNAGAPSAARNASAWRPGAAVALPGSVDWRSRGAVTAVKDQGKCASCWAFSVTGAIEGAWFLAGNPLQSLSEQQIVSCDKVGGQEGCKGGWPSKAIDWVKDNGIATEASYPYASKDVTAAPACSSGHAAAPARVAGHQSVAQDEAAMAAWVAQNGPLSVSVAAMTDLWWPYTGGVMSSCCDRDTDHAVLVVGFGEADGQKYWLIKNSWNAQWGENGYLRLERGTNQCNIVDTPVAPVVAAGPAPPAPPRTPAPAPAPPPPPAPRTPAPAPSPSPSPSPCPAPGGWCLMRPELARAGCDARAAQDHDVEWAPAAGGCAWTYSGWTTKAGCASSGQGTWRAC